MTFRIVVDDLWPVAWIVGSVVVLVLGLAWMHRPRRLCEACSDHAQ